MDTNNLFKMLTVCHKKFTFLIFLLIQTELTTQLDRNEKQSLLRPKGSAKSRTENGLASNQPCPGQGTCMSTAECEMDKGIRKMGLCPNRGEVCCKVAVAPKCGNSSTEWVAKFMTPAYPELADGSTECAFTVLPLPGVCALKVDFKDVVMIGSSKYSTTHKCIVDTFYILGIPNAPTEPLCDLKNYSAILSFNISRRKENLPVRFVFIIQSKFWKVNFRVRQIPCQEIIPWKNEALCGRQLMFDSPLEENQLSLQSVQVKGQTVENALIVNGQKAQGHEFPWQVSIQTGSSHSCGGSLIRPNLILTAAHCFHAHANLNKMSVRLGTANGTLVGQEIEIDSIIQHYEYKPFKTHLNDIAVVRLKQNVTYSTDVQPICLPKRDEHFNSGPGLVSGWGRLSGSENATGPPTYLQKLGVSFISNDDCDERMPDAYAVALGRKVHVDPLAPSQICAIAPKNSTVCFGDSGGPLVAVNGTDGTYRQVGIVSYGVGRCLIHHISPVVYTRVTAFLDFIAIAAQY